MTTRSPRPASGLAAASAVLLILGGTSPVAAADSAPALSDAVAQLRAGGQCGALTHDPIADATAEIVNRSTDTYVSHNARHVPVSDALPIYHDLGGQGGKAHILLGAAETEAEAIKGLILQGYAAIPDCSYTGFGVSMSRNADAAKVLTTVVLVGP
jgi:hypothetical protein